MLTIFILLTLVMLGWPVSGSAIPWAILALVSLILALYGGSLALRKAGLPGWGIWLPFYDFYLLVKLAARPGWVTAVLVIVTLPVVCILASGSSRTYFPWALALLVIALVALFLLLLDVAQNFGKGAGFGVLLFFPAALGLAMPHLIDVLGHFSAEHLVSGLFHVCGLLFLAGGAAASWLTLGLGKSKFVPPPAEPELPPASFPSLSPLVLEPVLRVAHLRVFFPVRKGVQRRVVGYVKAVDDVSFDVPRGQTLGLVGESGCGKTTVARSVIRLIPPTHGSVMFNDIDLLALPGRAMRRMRRHVQIIFQDPVGSLNPRMTVGAIVGEPLKVHHVARGGELADRVAQLLGRVGLSPDYINRYPHEFSGGQRQRIGIARALALDPELIICDEPVSALDVSIQSQILNLLADLQSELGLSYLFIAHNLAVVEHFCDVVAVMYLGKIVEQATAEELYRNPKHPYTMALLSAAPSPEPDRKRSRIIPGGEVPSPINPPSGCPYHPRCHLAEPRCAVQEPTLDTKQGEPGHVAACLVTK